MAMAEARNIDINVNTYDRTGPGLKRAKEALNAFDKTVEKTKDRLSKLAKSEIKVALEAIDRISPVARRAKSVLSGFAGGRPYRVTLAAVDRASRTVGTLKAGLRDLTARAWTVTVRARQAVGSKVGGAVDSGLSAITGMGTSMLAGAGVAYGGYDAVKTSMDFNAQMSAVGAITGAEKDSDEMKMLIAKAKEMGATTSFTATEAGKAFEYMAMAGWKTNDMLGGISGIMSLAAASGEDLGRVSDIVTDALTAFGLSAKDSAEFADVLAAASSNSNTNVALMGETFKYAAPVAGALKFSIQDTALAIGMMANAGIKGSEAGTALRAMFSRMVSPTKDSAAAMEKLRLKVTNVDGSMRPLRDILKDIRRGFADLSEAEKAETASMLAGQEAMSGLLSIANGKQADFDKLADAIKNAAGASDAMARKRMDNLAGDIKLSSSAWEDFQLTIMNGKASEGLRSFVRTSTGILQSFTNSIRDGLDISDITKLISDVLGQLYDKFIQFDGVGSVLAGGSLAFGLSKLWGITKKLHGGIKGILKSVPGAGGAGEAAAAVIGQEMVVNAQTVIVNGKSVTGSGVPQKSTGGLTDQYGNPIGGKNSAPSKTSESAPKAPGKGGLRDKAKTIGKYASKAALPLTAALGAYEIYNAKDGERAATAGNVGGGLVGGWAGAKAGAAIGGAIGSVVPVVGTTVGAAVGGAAGGIGGYLFGSDLGEDIGSKIGDIDWDNMFEGLRQSATHALKEGLNVDAGTLDSAEAWESFAKNAERASLKTKNNLNGAYNSISNEYAMLPGVLDAITWGPMTNSSESAADDVSSNFNTGKSKITSCWADLPNWFAGSILGPISSSAFSVFDSLPNLFSGTGSEGGESKTPHAWGGIMSVPHLGIVAEAGPEAIVPLGSGRRSRGLDIWQKAGQMLGVDFGSAESSAAAPAEAIPYVASQLDNGSIPFMPTLSVPQQQGSGPAAAPVVTVQVNATPTFDISGGEGTSPESIIAIVKAHAREMADDIGGEIAEKLVGILGNQPLKVV